MLNGIILLKTPYIFLIATRGSKCKNNLKEVMVRDFYNCWLLPLTPFSVSSRDGSVVPVSQCQEHFTGIL